MGSDAGSVVPAIVFDCDGVLADTERYGHLPAFNQTFAEFELPVHWSEEEYGEKLRIGGGKERMASLLTDHFIRAAGLKPDRQGQLAEVARWHARKTIIYTELVRSGALPARPGIRRITEDAIAAGWKLAVASTSAEPSVRAVLEHAVGSDSARHFEVFAGDVVAAKKPAPDIYLLALTRMARGVGNTIVIEDSRNGLLAATAARLSCVVTVNAYTADEGFDEAVLVLSSLGDPDGERAEVLARRCDAPVDGFVRLGDLRAAMAVDAGDLADHDSDSASTTERS